MPATNKTVNQKKRCGHLKKVIKKIKKRKEKEAVIGYGGESSTRLLAMNKARTVQLKTSWLVGHTGLIIIAI